jgi:FtsH-binding integral membrane protein
MSYADNSFPSSMTMFAAQADADARSNFITKTYLHLAGAIGLFVILEAVLLHLPGLKEVVTGVMFQSQISWLIVLGLFMVVSFIANSWATSAVSPAMQYAGLGLYVVAEAVIFVPLLYFAERLAPDAIPSAAVATLGLFGALTAVVFVTRKDFSFLRTVLVFGGLAAIGFIIVAALFSLQLGPLFIYAMIALACGYVLYHTSNVLHHYRIGQHVAAALALFASVALLFWYLLQLFMSRRD